MNRKLLYLALVILNLAILRRNLKKHLRQILNEIIVKKDSKKIIKNYLKIEKENKN